jgi:hypothetical protein
MSIPIGAKAVESNENVALFEWHKRSFQEDYLSCTHRLKADGLVPNSSRVETIARMTTGHHSRMYQE